MNTLPASSGCGMVGGGCSDRSAGVVTPVATKTPIVFADDEEEERVTTEEV